VRQRRRKKQGKGGEGERGEKLVDGGKEKPGLSVRKGAVDGDSVTNKNETEKPGKGGRGGRRKERGQSMHWR